MARTAMSPHILKFQCDERKQILTLTNDSNRDEYLDMYEKTILNTDDILRQYTPAEERELCERTKVRVDMFKMNPVWKAKRHFEKKKRLENRSERWINKMLVKAHHKNMFQPYTDEAKTRIKEVCALYSKKDNNVRLDIWRRQREKAAALKRLEQRSDSPISISSCSDTESEQTESEPALLSDSEPSSPALLNFQEQEQDSEPDFWHPDSQPGRLSEPSSPALLNFQEQEQDSEPDFWPPDPVPESQPERLSALPDIAAPFRFEPSQAPLEANSLPNLFSSDDEEESEGKEMQQRINNLMTALNGSNSDAGNEGPQNPEDSDEDDDECPFLL